MSLNGYYSEDSDEDPEEDGWLSSVEQQKAKMERRKAREDEMEERWEDEVWHLTMSVRLWGVVS
jgi:origin recognition complex subunit 5